jgi:hypothetical protein
MRKIYFILFAFISFESNSQQFFDNAPCNSNATPSSYTFDWEAPNFTYMMLAIL